MDELDDIQRWVAGLLRRDRALPKDETVTGQARGFLTGNDRLKPVEQAEIYREQFWLRHTSSLVEDYPGLGGIIGQADWERLVEEYLVAYPPNSWTLRNLGDRMAEHVGRSDWLDHRALCKEMAELEWAYVELFDAPERPPLDGAKLASIPETAWQSAIIVLSPALILMRTEYPIAELRRRLRDEEANVPIPAPDPQNLVLYRSVHRNLMYEVVGDGAYALLQALKEGVPLVPACERAVSQYPDEAKAIEVSLGQWFQEWARKGWVVDVEA